MTQKDGYQCFGGELIKQTKNNTFVVLFCCTTVVILKYRHRCCFFGVNDALTEGLGIDLGMRK